MPERESIVYEFKPFERRWLRFEKTMWGILVALLICASLGKSSRVAAQGPALNVEYERFPRSRSESVVAVRVDGPATEPGLVRLIISGELAAKGRMISIHPAPAEEQSAGDAAVYVVAVAPGSPATIRLVHRVEGIGAAQSHISTGSGPGVPVNQIILP